MSKRHLPYDERRPSYNEWGLPYGECRLSSDEQRLLMNGLRLPNDKRRLAYGKRLREYYKGRMSNNRCRPSIAGRHRSCADSWETQAWEKGSDSSPAIHSGPTG